MWFVLTEHSKDAVPENIRNRHTNSYWRRELDELHKELIGVSKEEAKQMYFQFCVQLPFYGFHVFPARHSSSWDMPGNIYIAIHVNGIFFLSAGKEVYYSFPFLEVLTHTSTPYTLQISFDNNQSIELRTNKGDEIISLIIDYKYFEFTKQMDNK
mgnify:CR=1 FL=1